MEPEVPYSVDKSLLLVPSLSHIKFAHTLTSDLRSIFTLFSHLRFDLPTLLVHLSFYLDFYGSQGLIVGAVIYL
jgi:hypothetical protein